ncbi:MAG: CPBP family glutamic-type intramembrane protease [Rhodanobacter sp.]
MGRWRWRGVLASFYGGVVEEIPCRLLLVSAFAWLLTRCNRRISRPWMFLLAIALAAALFGVAHLPAAIAVGVADTP